MNFLTLSRGEHGKMTIMSLPIAMYILKLLAFGLNQYTKRLHTSCTTQFIEFTANEREIISQSLKVLE